MKFLLALLPLLAVVWTEHCGHKNDCQKKNVTHCQLGAELGCSHTWCTCYDKNDLGLKCMTASDCNDVEELTCNKTMRHCMDTECFCENPHGFHPGGFPGGMHGPGMHHLGGNTQQGGSQNGLSNQ